MSIIQIILKRSWVVILFLVALIALAASGLGNIKIDSDYRIFFSSENAQLQAFEDLQDTYTRNDVVLFVIAPKNRKVFTRNTLSLVEELTEESWRLPYSIRVDSLSNFQHTRAIDDDLEVASLVEESELLSDSEISRIKQAALSQELLVDRLLSPDTSVTAVSVSFRLPGENKSKELPLVVNASRDLRDKLKSQYPDMEIYLTGRVMNNDSFREAALHDLSTIVPISFLVAIFFIALYMYLASHSVVTMISGTFACFIVIVGSIIFAEGVAGWLGINLSPPSANAPTMILTLAVADSIHILVTFFQQMRSGQSKYEAMMESLRVNFQPVFLTSLTTIIGFLSLNFSDSPPFHDLGNVVAVGVAAAWVLSIILLPALIMVLPVRVKVSAESTVSGFEKLAGVVISYRKSIFLSLTFAIGGAIYCIQFNELNDTWTEYLDEKTSIRIASDFTRDNLTGVTSISYSLSSQESGGVSKPEFLAEVDKFVTWYREQPEVYHVSSFTDIIKRLNYNMHGDDQSWYSLPESRELAAQYLLLYELSLPFGLDVNNMIDHDKRMTRVTVALNNMSTNELLVLQERAARWQQENTPSIYHPGSSSDVMFAHIGSSNVRSMLIGTVIALILISVIVGIALRSFKFGLISLIPNMIPAAVAFGCWGILVGEVGLSLSAVVGMTLGIVVDYTVHFLSKYLRVQREQGLDTYDAIYYAFRNVGAALFVTTVILVANFSVLAISDFRLNSDMGLMTALTIVLALVIDFFYLPPLLIFIFGNKKKNSALQTVDSAEIDNREKGVLTDKRAHENELV
jgi:predicted RND superfamily exporter protein